MDSPLCTQFAIAGPRSFCTPPLFSSSKKEQGTNCDSATPEDCLLGRLHSLCLPPFFLVFEGTLSSFSVHWNPLSAGLWDDDSQIPPSRISFPLFLAFFVLAPRFLQCAFRRKQDTDLLPRGMFFFPDTLLFSDFCGSAFLFSGGGVP